MIENIFFQAFPIVDLAEKALLRVDNFGNIRFASKKSFIALP